MISQCERCGSDFNKTCDIHLYCNKCNDFLWKEWEIEQAENLKQIDNLVEKGHSEHCACRQVWGDGECECDLYKMGYDPYWWVKQSTLRKQYYEFMHMWE